ncbi:hypothetical protein [Actinoplanes sp. L3-i22]|uniref:hypothetical protein n=1 Tax=Actinoplanes sp. L3-i22 TaxID=2836373 RepID=UPI001C770F70|nr:hypothetical protein [Actinoplanes sp. L3-i22]BCY07112.1 hypothetical protein L3i22_022000 [Actinoplanes sp. L3-i22]
MTYFSGAYLTAPQPPVWGAFAAEAAGTEAMRQPAAAIIQRCYRWLEAAEPILPQAVAVAPVLVTAVQQYAAQQYPASLQQVAVVVQTVQQLRAAVPGLPPL